MTNRSVQSPAADSRASNGRWLIDLLKAMAGRRIAVVGDLMLDEWLWGNVQRISPEAPVPVVEVRDHSYTLGGAGNVANNLAALGASVKLIGVIGEDYAGTRFLDVCRKLKIDTAGIVRVASRPTTLKMRIVAHNQQVVRADRESTISLNGRVQKALSDSLKRLDGAVDGVIVSDYGKGVVSPRLVTAARTFAHKAVLTGDPKPQNLDAFTGCDCLAPNTAEAAAATGSPLQSDDDFARAAKLLLARTQAKYVLITRGEHGMTLYPKIGAPFTVPAVARQVYDVSGAGDTVISALTLALAVGAPIERAVIMAALAAGVVVEKLGTATASPQEIRRFAAHEGIARPQRLAARPKEKRRGARRR